MSSWVQIKLIDLCAAANDCACQFCCQSDEGSSAIPTKEKHSVPAANLTLNL